ncbi:hypothetical protein, partial [Arthrobacter sp. WCS2018Hpa-5b]
MTEAQEGGIGGKPGADAGRGIVTPAKNRDRTPSTPESMDSTADQARMPGSHRRREAFPRLHGRRLRGRRLRGWKLRGWKLRGWKLRG